MFRTAAIALLSLLAVGIVAVAVGGWQRSATWPRGPKSFPSNSPRSPPRKKPSWPSNARPKSAGFAIWATRQSRQPTWN